MATLVQCTILRPGGTVITDFFGKQYHFKPDPQHKGAHVAAVDEEFAQHLIQNVSESFVAMGEAPAPVPAAPEPPADDGNQQDGNESDYIPPHQDGEEEDTADTGPVKEPPAQEPAQVTSSPEDKPGDVDIEKESTSSADPDLDDLIDMNIDDLHNLFEEVVGRRAHPKAKRDTLIAQIKAKRAEQG